MPLAAIRSFRAIVERVDRAPLIRVVVATARTLLLPIAELAGREYVTFASLCGRVRLLVSTKYAC
ncbi:hypothetical protein GCM10010197_15190 [Nocardioides luteus]|uniref:Uncharacterized protein n=1 Tax=Nocardioides luteus TaxID=1844 RepID=A0ABQ5SV18_9ACTN|nr:hypothetical protein GCM10010197_15190 [Nocardioides luteus]GLJ67458.1 hypothetical protein GCM10017579_14940 [Nocardioides luteus]